jgi:alpha-beta hydrolase superfamily lysophospholipase
MKHVANLLMSTLIAFALPACHAQESSGLGTDVAPAAQDLEFRSAGVTLSGTLLLPSNMIAAVVLVHGSGKHTRNISFAQALARSGVATLTYDKRGVGKSGESRSAGRGRRCGSQRVDSLRKLSIPGL